MHGSAVAVPFLGMAKRINPPPMEPGEEPSYPERRLWAAILIETFTEYETWLQRISCSWRNSAGTPVCMSWRDHLNKIKRECRDAWFDRICDLAGVDGNDARARLLVLDKQHGLHHIKFTGEPVNTMTRYFVRKAKSRNLITRE